MNFTGTGARLKTGDVGRAAKQIGIETAVLLAFLEVEANGRGFDNSNRPKMLFEPHIFWRNLNTAMRSTASKLGLAYAQWKPGAYPSESYTRLSKAIEIHENAAFLSASYGLGQIMGFNHTAAGHRSAKEMFETAQQGEFEQLTQLVTLMKNWGMAEMLQPGRDYSSPDNWRAAVSKYNGSGYEKNNYHVKAALSYVKHKERSNFPTKTNSTVLSKGSKGEAVRNLQTDLQFLGYEFALGVDGRFGTETHENVLDFQSDHNLTQDGFAGGVTLAKIKSEMAKAKVDKSPALPAFDKKTDWVSLVTAIIKGLFK